MHDLLKAVDQYNFHRCGMPSLFVLQYNLIARIDATCHFLVEPLTATEDLDFGLRSKLNWSKNAHEEHEAPNQILIGAMDHRCCTQLALGAHIEMFLESDVQGGLTPL
jgi:hypothetical protein